MKRALLVAAALAVVAAPLGRLAAPLGIPAARLGMGAAPLAGQRVRPVRPEEVIVLGDLADVRALASDTRSLFAVAPSGVAVLDLRGTRWHPPLPMLGGYPPTDPPVAATHDPAENGLWVATRGGDLYLHHLDSGLWTRRGSVPAGVLGMATDGAGDLWIRTDRGWLRSGRGMLQPMPAGEPPPAVRRAAAGLEERMAADPYLAADAGMLALDARARRWPLTAVASGDFGEELWIGAAGAGVRRWSPRGAEPWRAAGVPGTGVGAVAGGGDGPAGTGAPALVWFGGDAAGGDGAGVAAATADLERWWRWEAADGAPRGPVLALVTTADAVWAGAADGLFRLALDGAGRPAADARWVRLREADGLPDLAVGALAPAGDGVWAGTRRGLVRLDGSGRVVGGPYVQGSAVHALAAAGDTLWVGSDEGLVALTAAGKVFRAGDHPPGVVTAVAARGDALVTVTGGRLLERDLTGWRPPLAGAAAAGGVYVLRAAPDGILAGGATGLLRRDPASGGWDPYPLPAGFGVGPVLDVARAGDHLWLATPRGAVRLPVR